MNEGAESASDEDGQFASEVDDPVALDETRHVLSNPHALADIRDADDAYARGEVVRGIEGVRNLRC